MEDGQTYGQSWQKAGKNGGICFQERKAALGDREEQH
jgi:hypothetical protein